VTPRRRIAAAGAAAVACLAAGPVLLGAGTEPGAAAPWPETPPAASRTPAASPAPAASSSPARAARRAREQAGRRLDARIAAGTMAVAAARTTLVRTRPRGARLARLTPRSATGRPVRVAAATRRDGWVGVRLAERRNDELGWIRERDVRWVPLRTRVDVDLSARRLLLRRDGKVVLRVRVAVGAPGNPTPTGRFGVTDHLRPGPGGPYGCCILALSGHQTKLPPGWPGGDRLAIHGTTNETTIGGAVSSGCLRARAADLRVLMRRVPVGATVVVTA
jgi:lipoprotein-anchoring transpeptidase ErfK/SrfK